MQPIATDRVKELDHSCGGDVQRFLQTRRWQDLGHEDNRHAIRGMAARLDDVGEKELFSYVCLQAYIRTLCSGAYEEVPEVVVLAQQLSEDAEEAVRLEEYIHGHAGLPSHQPDPMLEAYGELVRSDLGLEDLQQDASDSLTGE